MTAGVLLIVALMLPAGAWPAAATMLGANVPDLMLDYVAPVPLPGANPEGYRRVRRAMAKKAIADARDAGLTFLRAGVAGYGPSEFDDRRNDLALWQRDPPRFWAALDAMFDDLDAAGMRLVPAFIWNTAQFAALAHDNVTTFIRDPNSASRRLFAQFLREFITRYKARKTILFYEMAGELNLLADLDLRKRKCKADPCIWGNFTTADINKFARETAGLIKALDPSHGVCSSYSLPRPAETHLARQPEFSRRGPDWTPDTKQEFARNLMASQQPFDIISIHIYSSDQTRPSGPNAAERFDTIAEAANAAHAAGKKLFIGEFGDPRGATPFVAHVLDEVVSNHVDFAAIWVWEFYQFSTFTPVTEFNVEPGSTDEIIGLLAKAEKQVGAAPRLNPAGAPRVVLTWPLPCAKIDRPINLAAVASDGARPVKQVEFFVDGKSVAAVTRPPYKAPFDPVGSGSRTAEIQARAISASGASSAFRSTVYLNGGKGTCDATGG